MPEKKELLKVWQVTDDDTGLYHIGEVDGLFQHRELGEYLERFGDKGKTELLEHLAYLSKQVIDMWLVTDPPSSECCETKNADIP